MSRGHQLNHITANSMVYMSLCPCNCPHPNPYNTKNATFSHDEQNCSFLKLRLSCTFSHITSCYFSFHGTYKGKLSAFKRTLNICKSLYHTICSQLCWHIHLPFSDHLVNQSHADDLQMFNKAITRWVLPRFGGAIWWMLARKRPTWSDRWQITWRRLFLAAFTLWAKPGCCCCPAWQSVCRVIAALRGRLLHVVHCM